MASPLFSSLEEAGADQGAERQQPRAANAVDVGDEGVDDLLAGLRAKEASRNARRRASPAAAGRDREATALRRTRQIARPAEPSAALASISQNTERLQTQAAKFSLHEATKEMLEAERAEWRSEVAALKHSLKLREAEVGELRRDLRLLGPRPLSSRCSRPTPAAERAGCLRWAERTCADQAEAKERDHAALTTRVAQLELTIELWVAEMSTGAKTKQRPSLPGSARAGSTEGAAPSPSPRAPPALRVPALTRRRCCCAQRVRPARLQRRAPSKLHLLCSRDAVA
eukprot:COSAG04_NODE_2556_length_3936_cov_167.292937_3_plen_285_part_00